MFLPTLLSVLLASLVPSRCLDISTPGKIPGTTSHYTKVGGHVYHYLRSRPSSPPKATILLLHGYPDLAYGWRYQVPHLTAQGYQVIVPDALGYADTESPKETAEWAKKKISTDMAELMDQIVPGERVIVGGHDWGAALTYKMAIWFPERVQAIFTISVPYWTPVFGLSAEPYVDLPELTKDPRYSKLGYQLQWRDFAWERNFGRNETELRWLLNAAYGGTTDSGQGAFSPERGYDVDLLPRLNPNPLVNSSDLEYYVRSYAKQGFRGPDNWYRTLRMDWEDERVFADQADNYTFAMPALFIGTALDPIFPSSTWEEMETHFDDLTIESVKAGHWAFWEKPDDVNRILKQWLSLTRRRM